MPGGAADGLREDVWPCNSRQVIAGGPVAIVDLVKQDIAGAASDKARVAVAAVAVDDQKFSGAGSDYAATGIGSAADAQGAQ